MLEENECGTEIVCTRCNKPNTEFSTFTNSVSLTPVVGRIGFKPDSWVKRVVYRYINALTEDNLETEINICQKCQSLMFRKLDKNK